jgi:alpha-glucosidase (family GH31 glycosyl hydrolase)
MIGDSLLATPLYGDDYAIASTRDVYLPAGKWVDYDTGKLYIGGKLLPDFPLPVGKTPLFVGGAGILLERSQDRLVARIYPLSQEAKEVFALPEENRDATIELDTVHLHNAKVIDQTTHHQVTAAWERFALEFPIEGGHTYMIQAK